MSIMTERVTHVHHWNENLFSFRTTRDPGYRFKNGHFTMVGLPSDEKPLMRAYSITSSNHEHELEFFSIKVQDGALTSKLQNLKVGDEVLVGKRSTGTLVPDNMLPGRFLGIARTTGDSFTFIVVFRKQCSIFVASALVFISCYPSPPYFLVTLKLSLLSPILK